MYTYLTEAYFRDGEVWAVSEQSSAPVHNLFPNKKTN